MDEIIAQSEEKTGELEKYLKESNLYQTSQNYLQMCYMKNKSVKRQALWRLSNYES